MRTFPWPRPSEPVTRGVAVLLPGSGYTVQAPLLSWCAAMLVELGWHVQAVEWTVTDEAREHPEAFVERAVELAFAEAPEGDDRLVVGKSFGTFALPWAVRHEIPGIWLTPVLTEPALVRALDAAGATHLAVGGDQDPLWRPESVPTTGARLVTVPGGDHGLTVEAGWRDSIDAQTTVFEQVAEHVQRL